MKPSGRAGSYPAAHITFRKIIGLLTVLMIASLLITGCQKKDVTLDVNALAGDLKNTVRFSGSMDELSDAGFNSAYTMDSADIAAKKIYTSGAASAEEIAVFEAKDNAAAGRIRTAVDKHIEAQVKAFTDYHTEELAKLNDPVIEQTGKYVILCVSDDNDAAKGCIAKYTK